MKKLILFLSACLLNCFVGAQTISWTYIPPSDTTVNWSAPNVMVDIYSTTNPAQPFSQWGKYLSFNNPKSNSVTIATLDKKRFFGGVASFYRLGGYQNSQVKLLWDEPTNEVNVIGYNIYVGPISTVYSIVYNAPKTNTFTVSNIDAQTFFAATTTNSFGSESRKSNELFYEPPKITNIVAKIALKLKISSKTNSVVSIVKTAPSSKKVSLPPLPF